MTPDEFNMLVRVNTNLGSVRESLARLEQRLEDHCHEEERRRALISPWVQNLIALAALAVSVLAVFGR